MTGLTRVIAILVVVMVSAPVMAAPALWTVHDDDSKIWIFGAIDNLPASVEWRTAVFDDALADADKVVFEVSTDDAATIEAGKEFWARGLYTDGTLLTDLLDDDVEVTLREAADFAGVTMGMVLSMRPWFAAAAVYVGSQGTYGLSDLNLASRLQAELPEERLVFLETTKETFASLDGISEGDQLAMLAAALHKIPVIPKAMDKRHTNWLRGTPEAVLDAYLLYSGLYSWTYVERIVYRRTESWMPQVSDMLESNDENLLIIETANLIGDRGMLHLLEGAGYRVERVQ
jgi:Uncharacterized protein conserved in bacteria